MELFFIRESEVFKGRSKFYSERNGDLEEISSFTLVSKVIDLRLIRGNTPFVREAEGSTKIALILPSVGIGKRFFTNVDLV